MDNYVNELLFMALALALVILLAWGVLRALKAMHPNRHNNGKLDMLLSLPVGARERIVLIQYQNHEYLLGITAGGINLLDKQVAAKQQAQGISENVSSR
jgi:flagellar protein FliO/FliZ